MVADRSPTVLFAISTTGETRLALVNRLWALKLARRWVSLKTDPEIIRLVKRDASGLDGIGWLPDVANQSQSFLTGRSDSIHTRPFNHTCLNWCAIPN
jgi:hypothetical protein